MFILSIWLFILLSKFSKKLNKLKKKNNKVQSLI